MWFSITNKTVKLMGLDGDPALCALIVRLMVFTADKQVVLREKHCTIADKPNEQ